MKKIHTAELPSFCEVKTRSRHRVLGFGRTALALGLVFGSCALHAQAVLQRGYNANVTGANLKETILNTANVATNFGRVFTIAVDDNVYAQPLYVPGIAIPGHGKHNVVYIATMSDTLSAFDADAAGAALWSINFATPPATPVPMAQYSFSGNRNIVGNLGILSTPVIDRPNHLIYLVAGTVESGVLVYRLHAVDIRSGAEYTPPGGTPGVVLAGQYGGLTFDARYLTQRVSLVLAANQVVIAFGALEAESSGTYSGWVLAYDKTTLAQSGIFATVTSGGNGGGVWQSGRPPAVGSERDVYLFTGNGYTQSGNYQGYNGVNNFSESLLKLDASQGLRLATWFTPSNWSALDAQDLDMSSSGPMIIPQTNLLAGGGKSGELYILDRKKLGKLKANDSQVVQKEQATLGSIRGGPVFWPRSTATGGSMLYIWGTHDGLKAYPFNGTTIAASPSAQGGNSSQIFPGGVLTLSANGEQAGSGIVWATIVLSGDDNDNPPQPGALYAFDAENVTDELWDSTENSARDSFGNFAKFVPPLVVNGKVYVATASQQVAVYGLLP